MAEARDRILTMRSECHQSCRFCTLKEALGPSDGGEAEAVAWIAELEAARADGATGVQLDGIDPLHHSQVLPLVAEVRRLGFDRLMVAGTGRRLADPLFRAAFFAAAPERTSVLVPIYGVTAAVHEGVTGAPGSFHEAMEALRAVHREHGAERVVIGTCATRGNIDEIAGVILLGIELGVMLWPRLPYPHDDAVPEGWERTAVRETDVVDALVRDTAARPHALRRRAFAELSVAGVHPCVLFHAERRTGLALLDPAARPYLHGAGRSVRGGTNTLRVVGASTVPCAEAPRCALAERCSRAHLAVYATRFGLDEFRPPE